MMEKTETGGRPELFVFQRFFVGNTQFLSAFSSPRRQHPATIRRRHSFAETVLVFSLSLRRLKGAYHNCSIFLKTSKMRAAKMIRIFWIYKIGGILTGMLPPPARIPEDLPLATPNGF